MQVGCECLGVEIVPARVEYCVDFKFEYFDRQKDKIKNAIRYVSDDETTVEDALLNSPKELAKASNGVEEVESPIQSEEKSVGIQGSSETITSGNYQVTLKRPKVTENQETSSYVKTEAKVLDEFQKMEGELAVVNTAPQISVLTEKLVENVNDNLATPAQTVVAKTKKVGGKRKREFPKPKGYSEVDLTTRSDPAWGSKLKFPPQNHYQVDWCDKTQFEVIDAGKMDSYQITVDGKSEDVTHIYSYNKVMSKDCLRGISNCLNQTNWRVLGWYINERDTREVGLKNFKFLFKKPMQSTGKEKFSVYVYVSLKDEGSNE